MQYRKCTDCGAALDAEEQCDCRDGAVEQICGTCRFRRRDGSREFICGNKDAETFACYVGYDDTCEDYEER